ncbi:hypothetical protein AMECASPLE_022845 [Ameca splendens]|uniref:Prohibitin n=1 Tax=Ameca splendens TaxID=208324 RepID=A0ABV1AB37_9TELE
MVAEIHLETHQILGCCLCCCHRSSSQFPDGVPLGRQQDAKESSGNAFLVTFMTIYLNCSVQWHEFTFLNILAMFPVPKAQQEAQRAQFYVEKAKQEQRQKIIQAEGEAEAAKMLGQAVTKNPGYLKLRKIRAAQNIAKTVAQSQNRVYLNADSLVLNLQDKESFNLSLPKK